MHILKIKQQMQDTKFSSQLKLKGPLSYLQQNVFLQKHSLQMPAKPQSFQDTTKQMPKNRKNTVTSTLLPLSLHNYPEQIWNKATHKQKITEGKSKMQWFMQKAYHLVGLVFFLLEKKKSHLIIGITGKINCKF